MKKVLLTILLVLIWIAWAPIIAQEQDKNKIECHSQAQEILDLKITLSQERLARLKAEYALERENYKKLLIQKSIQEKQKKDDAK